MGVVLAAYDPKLDRKVALKLLKRQGSCTNAEYSNATDADKIRLEREAQALAKLDHPNVVRVFDVGTHAEQLFIAMEFVEGQTLGKWMRKGKDPRSWKEVLPVFIAAGRGLAAAHGAGLVHRDFKPDNVMVDDNGRVRVMDFGLARGKLHTTDERPSGRQEASLGSMDVVLTEAGTLLGTPAYMSPEQFAGRAVEAPSDQFSFCVALWEALYGERPFPSSSVVAMALAVREGEVRPAPRESSVPNWLHEVLRRGLAVDPGARWPSMAHLLDALANDPAIRRRRIGVSVGVLGLLVGGTWGSVALFQRDAAACANMEQHLAGIWDASRISELEAAFEATGRSYAGATWSRVETRLQAYTDQWLLARVDACEATQRGEQSGDLLDRRMGCLDGRLVRLQAMLDGLAETDDTTLRNAVTATEDLPSLGRCADTDALLAEQAPPENPELASHVALVEEKLARAAALGDLGRYDESLALATAAAAEAEPLDYEPLHVHASLSLAIAASRTGDYEQSLASFERSYSLALGRLMDREAAIAARMIVGLLAEPFGKYEVAWAWSTSSEALSRRTSPLSYASHLNSVGILADIAGDLERAQAFHEEALEIRRRELGPRNLYVGHSLNNLAPVVARQGNLDQSQAYFEEAADVWAEVLGPQHPLLATCLSNLGEVARLQGQYDDAVAYVERAHTMHRTLLGADHPQLSFPLNNLVQLHLRKGSLDKARGYAEDSVRIREASLGQDNAKTAYSLTLLGNVLLAQDELTDARKRFRRAASIYKKHKMRIDSTVQAHLGLGQTLLKQGEAGQAATELEHALGMALEIEPPLEVEDIQWPLARALWASDGDRQRAIELAEASSRGYAKKSRDDDVDAIASWLDARRVP